MSILLTNIQRFSPHDGPGIRTTVFLKGCSLRCPWCSNPENLSPSIQTYIKDGVKGVYGKWCEPEELVKECLKDKFFYGGILSREEWNINSAEGIKSLPGGVTFSGGECLLQMKQLVPVCESLHAHDIHIAVETCLFVPPDNLSLALYHVDFFYCDIKILNEVNCKNIENGELKLFLSNFETLMCSGCPVVVRVPVIGGRTDSLENREAVKKLLCRFRPLKIELIKEHNLGESKYQSLGMKSNYVGVSDELMEQFRKELSELSIPVDICKI